MKVKKILSDTVGVSIGAVGISQANTIPEYGHTIGTLMGAGLVMKVSKKK